MYSKGCLLLEYVYTKIQMKCEHKFFFSYFIDKNNNKKNILKKKSNTNVIGFGSTLLFLKNYFKKII